MLAVDERQRCSELHLPALEVLRHAVKEEVGAADPQPEGFLRHPVNVARRRVIQVRRRPGHERDPVERELPPLVRLEQGREDLLRLADHHIHPLAQERRLIGSPSLPFPLGDLDQRRPVPEREQVAAVDDFHELVAGHCGTVPPLLQRQQFLSVRREHAELPAPAHVHPGAQRGQHEAVGADDAVLAVRQQEIGGERDQFVPVSGVEGHAERVAGVAVRIVRWLLRRGVTRVIRRPDGAHGAVVVLDLVHGTLTGRDLAGPPHAQPGMPQLGDAGGLVGDLADGVRPGAEAVRREDQAPGRLEGRLVRRRLVGTPQELGDDVRKDRSLDYAVAGPRLRHRARELLQPLGGQADAARDVATQLPGHALLQFGIHPRLHLQPGDRAAGDRRPDDPDPLARVDDHRPPDEPQRRRRRWLRRGNEARLELRPVKQGVERVWKRVQLRGQAEGEPAPTGDERPDRDVSRARLLAGLEERLLCDVLRWEAGDDEGARCLFRRLPNQRSRAWALDLQAEIHEVEGDGEQVFWTEECERRCGRHHQASGAALPVEGQPSPWRRLAVAEHAVGQRDTGAGRQFCGFDDRTSDG